MCSVNFANLSNFNIALRKLEIAKLEIVQPSVHNFEIVQPSLRNFEILQPSLGDFKIVLRKLKIAKLHSAISKVNVYSNIKWTCTFP